MPTIMALPFLGYNTQFLQINHNGLYINQRGTHCTGKGVTLKIKRILRDDSIIYCVIFGEIPNVSELVSLSTYGYQWVLID